MTCVWLSFYPELDPQQDRVGLRSYSASSGTAGHRRSPTRMIPMYQNHSFLFSDTVISGLQTRARFVHEVGFYYGSMIKHSIPVWHMAFLLSVYCCLLYSQFSSVVRGNNLFKKISCVTTINGLLDKIPWAINFIYNLYNGSKFYNTEVDCKMKCIQTWDH